jgi:hypothetical protein
VSMSKFMDTPTYRVAKFLGAHEVMTRGQPLIDWCGPFGLYLADMKHVLHDSVRVYEGEVISWMGERVKVVALTEAEASDDFWNSVLQSMWRNARKVLHQQIDTKALHDLAVLRDICDRNRAELMYESYKIEARVQLGACGRAVYRMEHYERLIEAQAMLAHAAADCSEAMRAFGATLFTNLEWKA